MFILELREYVLPLCVTIDVVSFSGDEAQLKTLKGLAATGSIPVVHVDDVCRAEIFLAEKESASGRYICSSLSTTVMALARFAAAKYPQYNVQIDWYIYTNWHFQFQLSSD